MENVLHMGGIEIQSPKMSGLSNAIWNVASLDGVSFADGEFGVEGRIVDAFLLLMTLAQRIAAGDVVIEEKGDSIDKKEYYDRLLKSVESLKTAQK